jgi:hypothetical protein
LGSDKRHRHLENWVFHVWVIELRVIENCLIKLNGAAGEMEASTAATAFSPARSRCSAKIVHCVKKFSEKMSFENRNVFAVVADAQIRRVITGRHRKDGFSGVLLMIARCVSCYQQFNQDKFFAQSFGSVGLAQLPSFRHPVLNAIAIRARRFHRKNIFRKIGLTSFCAAGSHGFLCTGGGCGFHGSACPTPCCWRIGRGRILAACSFNNNKTNVFAIIAEMKSWRVLRIIKNKLARWVIEVARERD